MTGSANEPQDIQDELVSFAPRVYGLLFRMVGRSDVAEDLTQETLMRAFRSLETYRPEGKFQAWIFRIAVNLARDWVRRRPREAASLTDEADDPAYGRPTTTDPPAEANLVRLDRSKRVAAAMGRLADADREVLLLRYYGDLPFKDIAQATGEPLGTVLARAHRALKKMGDMIPEDEL